MSDVKQALQRKLGPLPAWAWALIGGIALYVYRSRHAVTGASTAAPDTTAGGTGTDTGSTPGDVTTLQPGESAYNPATGQLVSTAPEQQPGEPQSPVTLDPGQAVFDPNTGQLVTNPDLTTTTTTSKAKPKKKHKRTPKAKPKHQPGKKVKHPGGALGKLRGTGKIVGSRIGKPARGHTAPKPRVRGKATASPSGAPRTRANKPAAPAQRQRPAAPRITHPVAQRTAPHPARQATPTTHPTVAVHPRVSRPRKRK